MYIYIYIDVYIFYIKIYMYMFERQLINGSCMLFNQGKYIKCINSRQNT